MERIHAVVSGLVQGVGFRYFVLDRAQTFGLGGWVRNRPDGSVEIEAEGETEALDAFLVTVRQGPRAAQVTGLRLERSVISQKLNSFEVR